MASYIALVRKDPDSDYGIEFPDFPGCISVGKTMDEVRRMGIEALAFHIAGMVEDGAAIPEPSTMEALARRGRAPLHSLSRQGAGQAGALSIAIRQPGSLWRNVWIFRTICLNG